MMSGIKSKDTKPEMIIRSKLHRLGFRYRLHDMHLPGKPDLVFPKYKALILVNGCFWHGHSCHLFRLPKSNKEFWKNKIEGNRERDVRNLNAYRELGWRVSIVWECALKGKEKLDADSVVVRIADWILHGVGDLEIQGNPDT